MRLGFLVAFAAVAGLSGCFAHGCSVTERAETWRQADYWAWRPDGGHGLDVTDQPVEPRRPWPDPPAEWRGNHTVTAVALRVGSGSGSTEHAVSIRDVRGTMDVFAFLPQEMAEDDRAAALRDALATATHATEGEIATLVAQAMASDDGGDDTGRILRTQAPGLELDLEALAAQGAWSAAPAHPGSWKLTSGEWGVTAALDSRSIRGSGWREEVQLDAGGFVRGPLWEADLTEAERREATTAMLASWGAPAPSYAQADVQEQMVCV